MGEPAHRDDDDRGHDTHHDGEQQVQHSGAGVFGQASHLERRRRQPAPVPQADEHHVAGGSGRDAGSYAHTVSGSDGNYDLTFVDGTLTIGKAALTVTANDASKTYDGIAWSGGNGVQYSGFVNGEDSSVLSGALVYGGSSQGAVNAGNYTISASGLGSGNYDIVYVDGNLTISPKLLTLIIGNLTGVIAS